MKWHINFLIVLLLLCSDITAQWFQQNSGTTTSLRSVFFIDANTGWACGSGGEIIKTTNGGLDWFNQNSNTTVGLITIQFINAANGWACGGNQILKTTDGGIIWSVQNFPPSTGVYTIQFVNMNIGWIISHYADTAYIQKSIDGGDTWSVQYQAHNEYYESMHFLNENTGWVAMNVGGLGGVIKTTDGGNIWTQYNANFSGPPMYIRFVNNQTGWTSHNTLGSYDISKSTDGGVTWFSQIFESFKYIHSINFTSSGTGYAAGLQWFIPPNPDQGFIIKTTDGGSNWFEQYRDDGGLNSIFFVNDMLGWAVGDGGKILVTDNGGIPVELVSFTSVLIGSKVQLKWSTATELNNLGFEIERKIEKNEWQTIGFKEGKGTTIETQEYSFIDNNVNVSAGKLFYRLKQIDFDGSFEYSDIIEVNISIPEEFELSQNYPNPFNPTTKIKYSIPTVSSPLLGGAGRGSIHIQLVIYDVLGDEIATIVNEEKPAGIYEVEWNASGLPSGLYFYQLRAGGFIETKKMLIIK